MGLLGNKEVDAQWQRDLRNNGGADSRFGESKGLW